ncbi:MAG: glycosyltransferase [Candidatus Marinimicrobia bacterium]|nr:glycosyltransferase [Candidatus Neomarinimicrobiota bacterium]
MKIIYINKTRLFDHMPSTVFSMLNAYNFAKNGADVTIILKIPHQEVQQDFESYFNLKPLGNFHIRTFSDKFLGLSGNEFFYSKINQWILSQPTPDVIFTRDPGYLPFLARIKKSRNLKAYYQSHNFYLDLSFQPDQKITNRKKYHRFEKKYLPLMDGMFTLNESQKKLYEKYINLPVHSVVPGLQKIYPVTDNFSQKIIVYSGSLQKDKGVDILLHSFAEIEHKAAKLVLLGGRHEQEIEPIRELAKKLKITDRIEITGWLSFDDVQKRLKHATVGVIPLKDTFYNRYLTAPSKLFDYIAHGIPVIASDLPAIRDIDLNHEHLFYIPAANRQRLSQALDIFLSDPLAYEKYQIRSHELAKNYRWQDCSLRMMAKF